MMTIKQIRDAAEHFTQPDACACDDCNEMRKALIENAEWGHECEVVLRKASALLRHRGPLLTVPDAIKEHGERLRRLSEAITEAVKKDGITYTARTCCVENDPED